MAQPASVGTYVVYAQATPAQIPAGHIHYAQIMRLGQVANTHFVTLCININLPMLIVAWVPERFCVLGKHRVDAAKLAIAAAPQVLVREAFAFAVKATAAAMGAVNAPLIVGAAAAPGLYGGAAIMNGLATLGGGTAIGGIALVSAAPALLAGEALNLLLMADENDDVTKNKTKIATRITSTLGASASVAAVPLVGGSLSAAGMTSGLAGIGSMVGGGMASGILICAAAPVLAVGAFAGLIAWAIRSVRQDELQSEYDAFITRWSTTAGYGGPP